MKKRTENIKKLGQRIRDLRMKKGITSQMDLANKIGTDRTYIGGIERGERNPTFEILEKLAKALGTSLSDLMRFDIDPNYSIQNKRLLLNDKEVSNSHKK